MTSTAPSLTPHESAEAKDRQRAIVPALKFAVENEFIHELRRRVDALFEETGRRKRDCWQMYLKTAILLTAFFGTYITLLAVAPAWYVAIPLSIVIGLVAAAIGFNIQHDGGHNAYSERPWINKLASVALDMIGGSSYHWHWKHGVYHHTYVNIDGHDTDVEVGLLGRLCPHQPRLGFHRWQHLYLWPLYGMLAIKWQLYDDFHDLAVGRIGKHKVRRPRGWDLALFIAGKVVALTLAFGIPMLLFPVWKVLVCYAAAMITMGMVMAVVFQLAHVVEEAAFPLPIEDTNKMENAWAVHQIQTTVNFARNSKVCSWLLGGLNFQIEHHLFPKICHINYPAMSKVVKQVCEEFKVKYHEHASFVAGVVSHYRFLREMGRPTVAM